jgi:pimeloyl-ACP methyl ester carboxylesterase
MLGVVRDLAATRRLVTVDAVGPDSDWMPVLHATALTRVSDENRAILEALYPRLGEPDPEIHGAYSRASYPAWFADPEFATYFTPPNAVSLTGTAIAAHLRGEGYHWHEQLRALSTPTLVLHGDRDALPAAVADEIQKLLPRARRNLLPHAGHMPFWEAPERFFELTDSFLTTGATTLP